MMFDLYDVIAFNYGRKKYHYYQTHCTVGVFVNFFSLLVRNGFILTAKFTSTKWAYIQHLFVIY